MIKRRYGNIVFTIFILLIFNNCEEGKSKVLFEGEEYFINYLNDNGVNTDSSKVFLLPSMYCLDCKKEGLLFLDSLIDVTVLYDFNDVCPKMGNDGYECCGYDYEKFTKKGLAKSYSQYIKIKNDKIYYVEAVL